MSLSPHRVVGMIWIVTMLVLLCSGALSASLWGQQLSEPSQPDSSRSSSAVRSEIPFFGPYQAIAINHLVVNDAKVDEELNVHLQLFPAHKDKQLIVKIFNERFSSHWDWVQGGRELILPANAG